MIYEAEKGSHFYPWVSDFFINYYDLVFTKYKSIVILSICFHCVYWQKIHTHGAHAYTEKKTID